MAIKFRKVSLKDTNFLFNLKNDELSIKNSIKSKKLTFKDHKIWIKKKISKNNKDDKFLIVLNNNKKIGMIRYDIKYPIGFTSINILKQFRGKGYGKIILKTSENFLKKNIILISKIKKNNKSSVNIFNKNNYKLLCERKYFFFVKLILNKE